MVSTITKRLMYTVITLALAAMAVATGVGLVGSASAQSSEPEAEVHDVCAGIAEAQEVLRLLATIDNVSAIEGDEFEALIEALDKAAELEGEGRYRLALQLEKRILNRIANLVATAEEAGDVVLAEQLKVAASALEECLDRSVPTPEPVPGPQVDSLLAYSAKFICGREVDRERTKSELFGNHVSSVSDERHDTQISVHNYGNRPIKIRTSAVVSRALGAPAGRAGTPVAHTLMPNQAVDINCGTIERLLNNVEHEVCEGKSMAREILREVLDVISLETASTSTLAVSDLAGGPAIRTLIKSLGQAIELEEHGKLKQALRLERGIAQRLEKIAARAEEAGYEGLAAHLTEAQKLVQRCVRVLVDEIGDETDVNDRKPKITTGFVEIDAPRNIEVTATYRARTNSATISGGSGSGIDVEVVQVRPHRMPNVRPQAADVNPDTTTADGPQ